MCWLLLLRIAGGGGRLESQINQAKCVGACACLCACEATNTRARTNTSSAAISSLANTHLTSRCARRLRLPPSQRYDSSRY
jgi:hypothetical protein